IVDCCTNNSLGKRIKVKCLEDDTIGDFKKLVAAQIGTAPDKIGKYIFRYYTTFKDHITLSDYEIHNGSNLELYYV
ncbi:hypothetical protein CANCADRAFT_26783, partial [Tortispora caseinolytica NRRL Y-17796]